MLANDFMQNNQRVSDYLSVADFIVVGSEMVFDETTCSSQLYQNVKVVLEQVWSNGQAFGSHFP